MAPTTNAQVSASVAIRNLVAPPGTVCSFLTGWAYRNLLSTRSPISGLYELHDALDLVFSGLTHPLFWRVLICKLTALLCTPSFLNPLKVNVLDRAPCEVR